MNISIVETSATVRTLEVSMPQEALKPAFEKKVTEYRKEVQMKGFRPGMVPRNMILSRFGDSIRNEAIDITINDVIRDELAKANIVPVSKGRMESFQDDKTNPIQFKLVIEIDPVIDIKGYKETGFTVPAVVISDVEVQDELTQLRNAYAQNTPVERAAAKGDLVEGVYQEVMIDGEEKALPERPEFRAMIGESSSPGFDEGLVGVSAGETREVLFTYPAEHKDLAYAGKSAKFKVRIDTVSEVVLPELDDEFAKQLGIESFEELKERVSTNLSTQKTSKAKSKVQEEAIDLLIEKNPFEVAETRIKYWINRQLHKNEQQGEDQEYADPTPEQMAAMSPQAIREIKKFRILEYIVKNETLKPTQADVDARIQGIALQYGVDFEVLKANLRQTGRVAEIREDLKFEKAMDLIVGAFN